MHAPPSFLPPFLPFFSPSLLFLTYSLSLSFSSSKFPSLAHFNSLYQSDTLISSYFSFPPPPPSEYYSSSVYNWTWIFLTCKSLNSPLNYPHISSNLPLYYPFNHPYYLCKLGLFSAVLQTREYLHQYFDIIFTKNGKYGFEFCLVFIQKFLFVLFIQFENFENQ